ncbi:MAG: M23 family metallopeptidase [Pseudomonadota bacterium]
MASFVSIGRRRWHIMAALAMTAMFVGSADATVARAEARSDDDRLLLSLPVACQVGRDCFIQNYVDTDAGAGARDHRCGGATYDGHTGVDFRLASTRDIARRVGVLAAADGIVKGLRDGMADKLLTKQEFGSVAKRECGNGVVLDHGNGWETQYCHLKRGSVRVKRGDRVRRGQRLGAIGTSGLSQFAHLEFAVRRNGTAIDPFTMQKLGAAAVCQRSDQAVVGLWRVPVAEGLRYRQSVIIEAGFVGNRQATDNFEDGSLRQVAERNAPVLLFFGRVMNLAAGDRVRVEVSGPDGFAASSQSRQFEKPKATWSAFAGKRLTAARRRWPSGTYTGRVLVLRGDHIVQQRRDVLALP